MSGNVALLARQAVPYMSAAAAAYSDAVLAEVRDDAADEAVGLGRRLLQRVFGVRKRGLELPEPVQNLVSYPQDGDALAALRLAVRTALAADPVLVADVQALLSASSVGGVVSGDRSIAPLASRGNGLTDPDRSLCIPWAFGIDLGTTYSVVTYIDTTGHAVAALNAYGEYSTPSVVFFESKNNIVVGRTAKDAGGWHPDQVVSLIKYEMGDREWSREFFGKEYTPQSISALILKALADDAEVITGHNVTDVVITVPAYFGLLEKDATKQAGEIAGLNVIGIVPEPVAVALNYGVTGRADGTVFLVYDLGGKTFDISLLKMTDTSVEILEVGGDHRLGGADWDEKLFEHIVDQLAGQWGDESVWDDEAELQEIRTLTERVKKDLSKAESTQIIRRYGGAAATVLVTRNQFEEMTADLLEETIRITNRTLAEAEQRYPGIRSQISQLLLAGGSSLMPAVSECLKREFNWEPRLQDPDLAVAKGAVLYAVGEVAPYDDSPDDGARTRAGAIAAGIGDSSTGLPNSGSKIDDAVRAVAERTGLDEEQVEKLAGRTVISVLPKALGVKVLDSTKLDPEDDPAVGFYIRHLIPAGTQLPTTETLTASTAMPDQLAVEIEIWEQAGAQESPLLEDNHQLITSRITGLPPLPAGAPIDISIKADVDGRIAVTAVEPVTGKRLMTEARVAVLSQVEIEEAKALHGKLTVSVGERLSENVRTSPAPALPGEPVDSRIIARERMSGAPGSSSGSDEGRDIHDSRVTDFKVPSTRYLAADLPERAPAGAQVSLLVRIVRGPASSGTPSAPLKPFTVPSAGAKVTVSVSAPGLVALGDLDQEVVVPAHADSEQVRFGFRAGAVGLHTVMVRAFAGGTFLGELGMQMSVDLGGVIEEGQTRMADLRPAVAEPGEVTLQVNRDGDLYSFQLISETWYPAQLSGRLAGNPADAVEALAAELRDMAAGRSPYASPELVRARLRNLGAQLWADAVPAAVRHQFWEQADRITSFSVASDLDNIPWELLYPVDGHNELGFLCEHYPLTRRVYGQGRARRLPLSSVAYVVPQGSPHDAMDEVEKVRARLGPETSDQGVLENLQDLTTLLDNARTDLFHFACHNKFTSADGSVVTMADGPFRPSDLGLAVQRKALAESGPLVFFNACRSAAEIPGFTRMMGWARQFMGAGAGAFIGSLWPVRSGSARDFADAFYAAFATEHLPLGKATLQARKMIAEEAGDPTWLAYTVYGNPGATAI